MKAEYQSLSDNIQDASVSLSNLPTDDLKTITKKGDLTRLVSALFFYLNC